MSALTETGMPRRAPWGWLILGQATWIAAYASLLPFADAFVDLLGLDRDTHLGEAIHFFVYDTPKVLLLLTGVVFVMGVIHTFVTPERTRALLSGRRLGIGNVMAASLGVVTPFCSCSAVPLFIGFLSAGVPLGVTFSFLISAPMVNEIALALLFGLFGWKVAALYLGLGLSVAIVAGLVIGRLGMDHHLEDWVRQMQSSQSACYEAAQIGWAERIDAGVAHVKEIVGRIWRWILLGIAIGAAIHGYVPQDFLASIMGKDAPWWSLPAAVIWRADVYQRCRHHPGGRSAARQGRGARHRAGFHDERDRALAARDDHPAQGAQAAADRHLRRCGRRGHPVGGLRIQCGAVNQR